MRLPTFLQILLSPFSLLYGIGIIIRDFLYQTGLLKGVKFSIPIISVGNLSVGGSGKTPHIEYLIRLLKDYLEVATLSRGYKRKTKGFLIATSHHDATHIGDEPLQYKRKFPEILVTVSESRTYAIPEIMNFSPNTQVVLLDDAFQHRAIVPGLNILLTEYAHPFTRDYLLPAGRLREWRSSYERADLIVVTKCPSDFQREEQVLFFREITPLPHQQLFFSYFEYSFPYYLFNLKYAIRLQPNLDVLLICAIARTDYLLQYLQNQVNSVVLLEFEDHHYFTKNDIASFKATFERMESPRKLIITTEKDAMRFDLHREFLIKHQLPIFVLPVEVKFHFEEGEKFNEIIKSYLLNFRA